MEPNPYKAPQHVADSQKSPTIHWALALLLMGVGAMLLMGSAVSIANNRPGMGGIAFGLLSLISGCIDVWKLLCPQPD